METNNTREIIREVSDPKDKEAISKLTIELEAFKTQINKLTKQLEEKDNGLK